LADWLVTILTVRIKLYKHRSWFSLSDWYCPVERGSKWSRKH